MKTLKLLLLCTLIAVSTIKCANQINPTGGPKDTIPPTLLRSTPLDQTINFNKDVIILEFDEPVNADKLQQKLIVTPVSDLKFKTTIKKEILNLELIGELADSTTYNFNFFDGVTDITEKNPAENLILSFSTGNYIDSLSISGIVSNLYTNKDINKMTIGLYSISDTLNVLEDKPNYFINTDEFGYFRIGNLRNNKYKLVGFVDENKNLKFDPQTEEFTFSSDTIIPKYVSDTLILLSQKINAADLKLISARPNGKYYEIRYSKPIVDYKIIEDSSTLQSNIVGEKDVIRFYNTGMNSIDSTRQIVSARDTTGTIITDTLYVKYAESFKKRASFEAKLNPASSKQVKPNTQFTILGSKPIKNMHQLEVKIKIDSFSIVRQIPITLKNHNTEIELYPILDKSIYESLLDSLATVHFPIIESDSTETPDQKIIQNNWSSSRLKLEFQEIISIEDDTARIKEIEYKYLEPEKYGTITYHVTTKHKSYIVELIDKSGQQISRLNTCTDCRFTEVTPGDYSIRVYIDNNKDGKWNHGNIRTWTEPEPIYHHEELTTLRANWTVDIDVTVPE